ncbi:MAG TPA: hypothetical protein VKY65_12710 [Alphaproteobacteria bacterium]|nr:hypothetical protein [Alphaproteobacteria bacterium]
MTQIDQHILNVLALATALLTAEAHGLHVRAPAIVQAISQALCCPYLEPPECVTPIAEP